MTAISIRSDNLPPDAPCFRAIAGDREAVGRTMGEALDALTAGWGEEVRITTVLIRRFGPDAFFTQAQHDHMKLLLGRRDRLTAQERQELEALVDAERYATAARLNGLAPPMQP